MSSTEENELIRQCTITQLKCLAKERGLKGYSHLTKTELIDLLFNQTVQDSLHPLATVKKPRPSKKQPVVIEQTQDSSDSDDEKSEEEEQEKPVVKHVKVKSTKLSEPIIPTQEAPKALTNKQLIAEIKLTHKECGFVSKMPRSELQKIHRGEIPPPATKPKNSVWMCAIKQYCSENNLPYTVPKVGTELHANIMLLKDKMKDDREMEKKSELKKSSKKQVAK
jgi:hypothetical protein